MTNYFQQWADAFNERPALFVIVCGIPGAIVTIASDPVLGGIAAGVVFVTLGMIFGGDD